MVVQADSAWTALLDVLMMLQEAQALSLMLVESLCETVKRHLGPGFEPSRSCDEQQPLCFLLACLRAVRHKALMDALLLRLVSLLGLHAWQLPWVRQAWHFLALRGHLSEVSCSDHACWAAV